jgi:hypothetical protein
VIGDCEMCFERDVEVAPCRIEIAVAFAKALARPFDVFPATSLLDYKGNLCVECQEVPRRTWAFFQSECERLARGGT